MVVFAFGHAMAEPVSHVEVPRTGQTSTASDLGRTRDMDVAISKWHVNGSIESKSDNDPHDYRAQLVTSIVDNFQLVAEQEKDAKASVGSVGIWRFLLVALEATLTFGLLLYLYYSCVPMLGVQRKLLKIFLIIGTIVAMQALFSSTRYKSCT